jgi:anti-anti-sigma regulatory factor
MRLPQSLTEKLQCFYCGCANLGVAVRKRRCFVSKPEVRFRPVVLKDDVTIVVSFYGKLDLSLDGLLKEYRAAIRHYLDVGAVILDFSEATYVHMGAFSALSNLQSSIRGKGIEVRVCDLPQESYKHLVKQGVFRQCDIFDSLDSALFPKPAYVAELQPLRKAA